MEISTILVPPARWKKAMRVKGGPEGKEQCRRMVIDLFPANEASFKRKKDHNRAEAALIALYAASLPMMRNQEWPEKTISS
jgi:hypothetical protein